MRHYIFIKVHSSSFNDTRTAYFTKNRPEQWDPLSRPIFFHGYLFVNELAHFVHKETTARNS